MTFQVVMGFFGFTHTLQFQGPTVHFPVEDRFSIDLLKIIQGGSLSSETHGSFTGFRYFSVEGGQSVPQGFSRRVRAEPG